MGTIAKNIASVKDRIVRAAERSGRNPAEIEIVAVTKTIDTDRMNEAIEAGVGIIGENKVQDALHKVRTIGKPVAWHMIGHLQRNKVKEAVRIFHFIHSLDSLRLAEEINTRALNAGTIMDVLVQINTSREETKYGCEPEEAIPFLRQVSSFKGLSVRGLMTIGEFLSDPEEVRPCFQRLRELRDSISAAGIPNIEMEHLSMGMTNDFEVAVEEGATLVRVGTAIFGERTS